MKRSKWLKLMAAVAIITCATSVMAEETATAAPIKGNPESKIYHKPVCRHYKAKSCTKEFKTEAEAKKAGYKPCKQCAAPKKEKKKQPASEKSE